MERKEMMTECVKNYLDSQGWHYSFIGPNNDIITMGLKMECNFKSCKVFVYVTDTDIEVFTVSPINASAENYANAVEFITRANYSLKIGNFEFDYRDGEVRYKAVLTAMEGTPSMADVERTVDIGPLMMQRYGDGLLKNMVGLGDPAKDIAAIEG